MTICLKKGRVTLLALVFIFAFQRAFCRLNIIRAINFHSVDDTSGYFHYTGGFFIISGHRGRADYPENCIPTCEHTFSVTPAMFEIDPHLTRDSGIVLLHDAVPDRVNTKDSVDIIESGRSIEVAEAMKSLYPKKSRKYKYCKTTGWLVKTGTPTGCLPFFSPRILNP